MKTLLQDLIPHLKTIHQLYNQIKYPARSIYIGYSFYSALTVRYSPVIVEDQIISPQHKSLNKYLWLKNFVSFVTSPAMIMLYNIGSVTLLCFFPTFNFLPFWTGIVGTAIGYGAVYYTNRLEVQLLRYLKTLKLLNEYLDLNLTEHSNLKPSIAFANYEGAKKISVFTRIISSHTFENAFTLMGGLLAVAWDKHEYNILLYFIVGSFIARYLQNQKYFTELRRLEYTINSKMELFGIDPYNSLVESISTLGYTRSDTQAIKAECNQVVGDQKYLTHSTITQILKCVENSKVRIDHSVYEALKNNLAQNPFHYTLKTVIPTHDSATIELLSSAMAASEWDTLKIHWPDFISSSRYGDLVCPMLPLLGTSNKKLQ